MFAERVLARVPRDAVPELAPQHGGPDLIADDGAHGPPAPHGRLPPGRRRRCGRCRRRNCRRASGRRLLAARPLAARPLAARPLAARPLAGRPTARPEARRRWLGQVVRREGVRRDIRSPQRNRFCGCLRRLSPPVRPWRLSRTAWLRTQPPSARFWGLSPCSRNVTATTQHRRDLTLRVVRVVSVLRAVRRPPAG